VTDPIERWRVLASGTVQGVGFRPFVYRLAHDEALLGEVSNEGLGASLEIQGPTSALERFVARLRVELPIQGTSRGSTSRPCPSITKLAPS